MKLLRVILLAILTLAISACGATSTTAPTPTTAPTAETQPSLRRVTLAMSYIPNIQFAPYYVTAAKGYYAAEGIEVVFDYNFENDVLQRAATWPASGVEFATTSGTSVLLARQQGIPVKTVMTLYQRFPIAFFAKSNVPLQSVNDLRGQTIGIPGRFGESFYALLAALYAGGMSEADITVQEIGFTQAAAVMEDKIPVATGYAMNEPVQLRAQGVEVNMLLAADIFNLAANGIAVSEALIEQEPDLVRRFVRASLRGLADTLANPAEAFDLSLQFIPEAQLGDPELQRKVLEESLPFWQNETTRQYGLGYTDGNLWVKTEEFMRAAGLLPGPVEVNKAFTNEFLPPAY
ncbi:ABC transporter substrate-binding protein [Chloroflexus sp.]|uniref:ABC transporter substrate-binding protein n=1 Tax=Chloroflexus sp. TaxID=1904827 RepID=UPI00260BBE47|nr:ABC transporter substrate-binding protein [uncultured Chloroflexus sp.]